MAARQPKPAVGTAHLPPRLPLPKPGKINPGLALLIPAHNPLSAHHINHILSAHLGAHIANQPGIAFSRIPIHAQHLVVAQRPHGAVARKTHAMHRPMVDGGPQRAINLIIHHAGGALLSPR